MADREEECCSDFLDIHRSNKKMVNRSHGQVSNEKHVQVVSSKNRNIENDSGYWEYPSKLQELENEVNSKEYELDEINKNENEEDYRKMQKSGNTVTTTPPVHVQRPLDKFFEMLGDLCKDCFLPLCITFAVVVVAGICYYLYPYIKHVLGYTQNQDEELRILIIGQSGSGKSSLANGIIGYDMFQSNTLGNSQTRTISVGMSHRFGRNILVVDTPGLFDRSMSNRETLFEITKCFAVTSPGLHSILLTIGIGRINDEDLQETIDIFLDAFGENALSFTIVVFTNKHLLDIENISVEEYLASFSPSSSLLSLLQRIDRRYIVVGYKGNKEERKKEIESLIELIDKTVRVSPQKLFQNEIFRKSEGALTTEIATIEKLPKSYEKFENKISRLSSSEARLRTRKIIIEENYSDDIEDEYELPYARVLNEIFRLIERRIGI